ncbi:hypothetical protein BJX62DRAFT_244923 [Aspergillus germanicus]
MRIPVFDLARSAGDYEGRAHEFRFTQENTVVTGLGLGFLAATAVIASPSLSDFPAVAADAIRVAMRVGLVVYQTSQDLDRRGIDAPIRSWTTLVKGLGEETVQRELDHFNESTSATGPGRIYISVVEPDGSVFINGPPSRMQSLFKGPGLLASTPRAPLPVYGGPCHAFHLYDSSHVACAVQYVRASVAQRSCVGAVRLLSMADGHPVGANTVLELLQNAAHILLTSIIRWGNVVTSLKYRCSQLGEQSDHNGEGATDVLIESCRSPPVIESLVSIWHETHPDCSITLHDLAEWLSKTVGTIYGQCSDDYREANAGQEIDMYFIPGNYRAFAPKRISYFFKFSGPSFSCDTACSASPAAVQIACAALSRGEANIVVAGGLNNITSSELCGS